MSRGSSSRPSFVGTIRLRSPAGRLEAAFLPRAGMLGWSLQHGGDELVARPVSLADHGQFGAPTGIALLHPWANRLACPQNEIAGRRVRLDMSAPNVHPDPGGHPIH